MSHLEEKGIVHRDLAARNILVGETLDIIKVRFTNPIEKQIVDTSSIFGLFVLIPYLVHS